MAVKPKSLTIRSYQVGFGDCFLLTFHYHGKTGDRHVLVDFGSTAQAKRATKKTKGSRKGAKKKAKEKEPMVRVAEDIKEQCKGKLHAVIATHRHKDHISGFATNKKGTAPGDIIASCNPDVVLQPWTEHPQARVDATQAPTTMKSNRAFVAALHNMHAISAAVLTETRRRQSTIGPTLFRQLTFLGEDNLKNESAVENLMRMGKRNLYLSFGSKSGLEKVLPGVKTTVLGPPTLKQTKEIKTQRHEDEDQFWQFQALANQIALKPEARTFRHAKTYPASGAPPFTRWFIKRMRSVRGDQLLGIVRALDRVLNNTSLILLFEVNGKKLLFPGDAQIENWSYALSQPKILRLLSQVNVYKVGHHGSRNATPKTLWAAFKNRSTDGDNPARLKTLMSTMSGKHGDSRSKTEVPRDSLLEALESESELFNTQKITKGNICLDCTITF